MSTNNNPITEIGAIVLAAVLIIVAGMLVYVGKFTTADAGIAFTLAVGVFAGNLALKAPSPAQQAALLSLTAQALQAQQTQPALAPVPVPQSQFMQAGQALSSALGGYSPTNLAPTVTGGTSAMPSAMLTTQNMPTVKPPQ